MNLNEYQQLAARTLIPEPRHEITEKQWQMVTAVHKLYGRAHLVLSYTYAAPGRQDMTLWNITGLLGETGELIDVVKKDIFHQHPTDPDVYKKEVGDLFWYWAACCTTAGYEAGQVAVYNATADIYAYVLALFYRSLVDFVKAFMPFTLEEVWELNIAKLRERYPNGFDPADSLKRVDVQ